MVKKSNMIKSEQTKSRNGKKSTVKKSRWKKANGEKVEEYEKSTDKKSKQQNVNGLSNIDIQTGTPGPRFNKQAVICPYFSNVRSILEYGSVIWAGATDTHTVRVDRVQHKFLIWLLTRTSSGHTDSLAYSNLLRHFRISSLSARRVQHDLLFIRNVFHSKLDSQNLLTSFSLHAPARSTRTIKLFHEICPRVNTVKGSLFCRMPRLVNPFLNSVPKADFFADSFVSFKNRVITYIASL